MRLFLLLVLVLWLTADRSKAEELPLLTGLTTADSARPWEAVGRVNLIGTGFCTGTLIAPKLVLTAAHCIYDKRTGARIDDGNIEFLAGWRDGRAAATRWARRVVIHPDYRYQNTNRMDRVAADIALIELDHPIKNSRIVPFGWSKRPRVGQKVQVVSYARDRAESPSLQETCNVLGRDPSVLVLSCQVNFGASGSPIFVIKDGRPLIASIISAKAEWKDRRVSLGASLGRPLLKLMDQLAKTDGVFHRIESTSADNSLRDTFKKP